ncbi:MAG TPA: hypothetical protein VG900_15030 [Hyphomicrobiaceae bacterium]|nr:hypothetical protein [Hyphomicrobiaceae bacterium]
MRSLLAVVLVVLLAAPPAAFAARQKSPRTASARHDIEFSSRENILRWINNYRTKPEPDRLPEAVKAMSALGIFHDLDSAGVFIGFMAGVLETNPQRAEELVSKMFPMPPPDQVAIVRAIAYSNLPNWKTLLQKFSERMPARKVLIDRFVNDKLPTLKKMALDAGPAPLDMLWGNYFATGSFDPVARMISILAWSKDPNKVDRLTVGSMAKLTLATNASQDKELLDMLKSAMRYETKDTKAVLKDVIEAAETFEFARVRKDAVAAIDQLKTKGPASVRNYQWWGQAGQTALALGCIVAGAMGHVEVGVPCIVGGAVSGAALKYLGPQQ